MGDKIESRRRLRRRYRMVKKRTPKPADIFRLATRMDEEYASS